MKNAILKISLLLVFVSAIYAGVSAFAQSQDNQAQEKQSEEKQAYEPAGKFVPTEKLKADDTVDFPVDI
jgi:flagellar basal body-associated protein FliL